MRTSVKIRKISILNIVAVEGHHERIYEADRCARIWSENYYRTFVHAVDLFLSLSFGLADSLLLIVITHVNAAV